MDAERSSGSESVLAGLQELVTEAKRGNAAALPQIRRILDDYPQIWQHYGDLAQHVEGTWLDLLAGDDACVRESLARAAQEQREQLLDQGDSPLERLLIDRIVVSWLMTAFFEAAEALAASAPASRVRFVQRQSTRAQKRHAAAVKSLAEVRKLLGEAELATGDG